MTSASWALLLLLSSGTIGVLGLWQLLAGTSRRAELAARGQRRAPATAPGAASSARSTSASAAPAAGASSAPGSPAPACADPAGRADRPRDHRLAGQLGRAQLPVRALSGAVIVGIGASILIARALIERRRGKRSEAFIEQLPEIGRMLANGAAGGPLDAAVADDGRARARRPRRLRAAPGGRRAAARAVGRRRAGQPARPAAVARGLGADDDDRDPAARRRRHRARPRASWRRRSTRARTSGARS